MNTDYSILGLEQGASQAEIKKAYFKMVRLHSPESDPEQFQKIRQAYEHLKNAKNKPDGPVFPPLRDPWAVKMMKQIQIYRSEKNMPLYRDACEEAWGRFPNDIQFLYLLIMAQRRCGNTGKAVKNAELLVSKDPENPWFQMALAFSYKERGFTQKALAASERAYQLGCRDMDFLLMYASSCSDNYLHDQGIPPLLDIIQQDKRWTREEVPRVMECYRGLIVMNHLSSSDHLSVILSRLNDFIGQYSIYTKDFIPSLCLLIANACTSVSYQSNEYQLIGQFFSAALAACREEEDQKFIHSAMELYDFHRAAADPRIGDMILSYLELFHDFDDGQSEEEDEDKMLQKFYITDLQLCMIEERAEILTQAAVLKQEHPQEYEKIADFIQKLENEPKIRFLKDSLLKVYRRLEPFFSAGEYYELYPQEKHNAKGTVIYDGSKSEPYIRSTGKIGRNDPCPCGSGKKYKHCCMNK